MQNFITLPSELIIYISTFISDIDDQIAFICASKLSKEYKFLAIRSSIRIKLMNKNTPLFVCVNSNCLELRRHKYQNCIFKSVGLTTFYYPTKKFINDFIKTPLSSHIIPTRKQNIPYCQVCMFEFMNIGKNHDNLCVYITPNEYIITSSHKT